MVESREYERNLEIIRSRFPDVANQLENTDASNLRVVPARRRGMTIRTADGISLHSGVDPVREAEDLIESRNISGSSRWIVFGFGLGYHVEAAVKAAKRGDEIIVVEFCPEVMKAALENVDMAQLLEWQGLRIWLPKHSVDLEKRIDALTDDVGMLVHPPSLEMWRRRKFPYAELLNMIEVERKNWLYSASDYTQAIRRNRAQMAVSENAETYFKHLQGEPIVIAGAGPSLDDTKPLIKRYRLSIFLLAANASFLPLRNAGITPDAVICVEPRSAAQSSFDGNSEDGIPLLFVSGTNPDVVSNWHGPKVVANRGDKQSLPHTGTVIGAALDVAVRIGANPIILTGVDLALSRKWYAEGVRKSPMEATAKRLWANTNSCQTCEVMGIDGQLVPSTPAFQHFVKTLGDLVEKVQRQFPQTKIYDLKAYGAKIEGTTPMLPTSKSFELILGRKYQLRRPSAMIERFLSLGVRT